MYVCMYACMYASSRREHEITDSYPFLNAVTKCRRMVIYTPRCSVPRVLTGSEVHPDPQVPVWTLWRTKKSPSFSGYKHRSRIVDTTLTELTCWT